MRYIYLLIILSCFSCNNERVLQLPEIKNAETTEVLDVSPAYIFYDETQADSTFLNRKNLIISTNWLVNVDKRLNLRQAIPKIMLMQDKKRNADLHKNEEAKNYFTCNDTSISNLGFLEFTDVYYEVINLQKDSISFHASKPLVLDEALISEHPIISTYFVIDNENKNSITDIFIQLIQQEKKILMQDESAAITGFTLIIYFDKNLSFQDYITVKSKLETLKTDEINIITKEFIF